jgi:hypothetical protein
VTDAQKNEAYAASRRQWRSLIGDEAETVGRSTAVTSLHIKGRTPGDGGPLPQETKMMTNYDMAHDAILMGSVVIAVSLVLWLWKRRT